MESEDSEGRLYYTIFIKGPEHHLIPPFRCDFEDTAQYRASAMNVKGELSAYASVVVKSRFSGLVLFKM